MAAFVASCATIMSFDSLGAWAWFYGVIAGLVVYVAAAATSARPRRRVLIAISTVVGAYALLPVALFVVGVVVYVVYGLIEFFS